MGNRLLWLGLVFVSMAFSRSGFAGQSCEKLQDLQLPKVEITSATGVRAGVFASSVPTVAGKAIVRLAAHCEVRAVARPTSDSEIGIEIWLPAENWNGKYQQVGNGGWAGAIHEPPLAGAVRRGFVAAATDDGHKGGITDDGRGVRTAEFAIGHPEKLIDYGYRALSETRTTALAAIRAFYGRDAVRSYFVGCSDGGREALMVAQRFPEDFDGILAGDPGNDWSHWAAGLVWNEQAQLAGSPGAIPTTKRALIQHAVIAACDAVDGVVDGLISDPRFCHFDPAVLTCKGGDAPDCLTAAQVVALKKVYDGPKNPRTGEQIYPGYPPGIENAPGSNLIAPSRHDAFSFGDTWFGQALFEQQSWDSRTLDFDKDVAFSDRKGSPVVDAINPDLRSFRDHGGKLIQYHGWSDALIPPGGSVVYYERVAAFMSRYPDPRSERSNSVDTFYRLFMIPGMGHCYGGAGPTSITPTDGSAAIDPEHDLMSSLEQWVEKGIAPDRVIGSGKAPNDPGKTLSRPICPYPQVTRYKGRGDTHDAASFECARPDLSENRRAPVPVTESGFTGASGYESHEIAQQDCSYDHSAGGPFVPGQPLLQRLIQRRYTDRDAHYDAYSGNAESHEACSGLARLVGPLQKPVDPKAVDTIHGDHSGRECRCEESCSQGSACRCRGRREKRRKADCIEGQREQTAHQCYLPPARSLQEAAADP
jgi:feruloyl esterase